jgi:hypothetical protein
MVFDGRRPGNFSNKIPLRRVFCTHVVFSFKLQLKVETGGATYLKTREPNNVQHYTRVVLPKYVAKIRHTTTQITETQISGLPLDKKTRFLASRKLQNFHSVNHY